MSRDKIKDLMFSIRSDSGDIDNAINLRILNNNELFAKTGEMRGRCFTINDTINISNCLFTDDLARIEDIQDKTLAEYIQEKLEFFDFSLENKGASDEESLVNN